MDFVNSPDRLTTPMVRDEERQPGAHHVGRGPRPDRGRTSSASKAESGGKAFATLASAKCTNEENYVLQKFTRGVIGTNNVDHCARL